MSAIEQPTTPRKRVPLSSILDPSNTQQGLPTPFTTPRRRKQPPQLPSITPPEEPWPRLGAKIPLETLKQVTRELFGYEPRQWQLDVFTKIAEGYDAIAIAGTGYGKSLVFALLAIAAVLARKGGMVLVISPLKALEKDQVRRFRMTRSIRIDGVVREIRVAAVAR
ncbi:ATP-dependent DNA helicase RecQ [Leucoagaricus sp. SymC.cos]|nr:ATP-dependent DNA helicase RecQ [Leucoagaricus sp. SymC.cos]